MQIKKKSTKTNSKVKRFNVIPQNENKREKKMKIWLRNQNKMYVYHQTPPSYEDLFNNIYMTNIRSSVNQSMTAPSSYSNIPHLNPNIESCSNPNRGSQTPIPIPILQQPTRISPVSNQNRTVFSKDCSLWTTINLFFACCACYS